MPDLVRVLAIDYGRARIGLAVSDDLGMLAHPLETVAGGNLDAAIERIAEIAGERKIETIVIGLPLRMDGTEGSAVEGVRRFAMTLSKKIPEGIAIVEVDERLSTVSAMAKLHEAGRTEKNSRDRIDQAAAVEILQEYLNTLAPPLPVHGEDDEPLHE